MLHKTTTNNSTSHHIVIGDILLHSEKKLIPIQVQILTPICAEINEKLNNPRLLPSTYGLNNNQMEILCDLKNPIRDKVRHERILSTKKLMRLHKFGWDFVKELKSKVIIINNSDNESKTSTKTTNMNKEQTHF